MLFKFRDLTVIDISPEQKMVVACDSAGGIGNRENDVVKVDPEMIGFYTTQGALMELLCQRVKPVCLVDNLGVEMEPTGRGLITGIEKALEPLNYKEDILITGSTEENIQVSQTFIGITIIGLIEKAKWRAYRPQKGDILVALGIPLVGDELVNYEGQPFNTKLLLELLEKPYIKDIIPVGSKGIEYEMNILASTNDLNYNLEENILIDIKKSAGPSTCAILAMDKDYYETLKREFLIPIHLVGTLTI